MNEEQGMLNDEVLPLFDIPCSYCKQAAIT